MNLSCKGLARNGISSLWIIKGKGFLSVALPAHPQDEWARGCEGPFAAYPCAAVPSLRYSTVSLTAVVEQAIAAGNNSVLALKYEIRPNVVSKWVRQYKAGQAMRGSSPKGNATHVTQQEHAQPVAENRELDKQNAHLKQLSGEEEFAVLLTKALGLPAGSGVEARTFPDQAAISPWATGAVETCVRAGILHGYEDGTFSPNMPITAGGDGGDGGPGAGPESGGAGPERDGISDSGVGEGCCGGLGKGGPFARPGRKSLRSRGDDDPGGGGGPVVGGPEQRWLGDGPGSPSNSIFRHALGYNVCWRCRSWSKQNLAARTSKSAESGWEPGRWADGCGVERTNKNPYGPFCGRWNWGST